MSKVKAAYNYSYNYEGKKISFKKDEEFQLLNKSNKDWWQVRRWMDGAAQDIYVPAVYVKEVEGSVTAVKEAADPTYMNLDDIKVPKSHENGTKSASLDRTTSPVVSNKPKARNSFKRNNSLDRTNTQSPSGISSERRSSADEEGDRGLSSSLKSNGLNTVRPISPGMLRRLNKGFNASGLEGGQGSSLKRGENLGPPPPVSTKPRSKSTTVDAGESSLDISGVRNMNRQTSGGQVPGAGKGKVPPPVLTKPRPQKVATMGVSARPASCMVPGMEKPIGGGAVEATGRPIVSELSNVLLKKKPHLAGEHMALGKTSSLDVISLDHTSSGTAGAEMRGEGVPTLKVPMTTDLQQNKSVGDAPTFAVPPPPNSPPPLPAGWTEHKTSSGNVYFYNTATGQSSWTRPEGEGGGAENKYLEKVAPRGWTKEINPITRTPVYTNSSNGERWALGSDAKGNHYYYNMANSSITVGELPEVEPEENLYDSLLEVVPSRVHMDPSTPTSSPIHHVGSGQPGRSLSNTLITETIASSLSDVLKRHGYLHRKRVFDAHGKKCKDRNWLKHYVTLQGYELIFYTDLKSKDAGQKPVAIFCLLQTTVSPYNKDKKKANVFQVSSHLGEQFLLQAETSNLMNEWYSTIQTAIDQANHDFRDNPDKFKSCLVEPFGDDLEGSPKLSSLRRGGNKMSFRGSANRNQSVTDELGIDDEDDIVDDMEISAAERSGHIRGRLRRLMARRPEKDTLKTKGILEDPVFGCELATLCERQGTTVPKFFTQFTQHIEKVGLDVVGIYRLSGNAASINKLRYQVEQDQKIDLDNEEWSDVNIVTGCLKLYLRELPDPLIPFRMYKPFIEAARAPTQAQRVQNIAARVKELPSSNYPTLKALIMHLRKVVEFGSVNKMLPTNVAIVFGPTVMRAETDSIEMATLMPIQNGIVEIMVNEFETIFRK